METWAFLGEASLTRLRSKGAVALALPYDPRPVIPDSGPVPDTVQQAGGPGPYLRVGAFAAHHRYAALARLLKSLAKEVSADSGLAYTGFRVAVNSGLPEKQLAEMAGLGYRGRSDLILSHAYGPACILGILLLPFDPIGADTPPVPADEPAYSVRGPGCRNCEACAQACPGRAIDSPTDKPADDGGGYPRKAYHREACIQHWMSTAAEPPPGLLPAFASRLYGCDACILACPHAARAWLPDRPDGSSPAERAEALLMPDERRPGGLVSANFLAQARDDELKAYFRKTALGFSWLGPDLLRRNAERALRASEP